MQSSLVSNSSNKRSAREAREWIVRLDSGDVDETCLSEFKQWKNNAPQNALAFERERRFWKELVALEGTIPDPKLPSEAPPRLNRRKFLTGSLAVASAASVAAITPFALEQLQADYVTDVGKRTEIDLPDGSHVVMNTDSAIAVSMTNQTRQIKLLRGELECSTSQTSDIPLEVHALNGYSSSREGTFIIKQLDDQVSVTVVEGEARVRSIHNDITSDTSLGINQQTTYGRSLAPQHLKNVNIAQAVAWKSGRIVFDNSPFENAVSDLERYVVERIILAPGVDHKTPVSGTFNSNQAHTAISALARIQGRSTTRIPGIVILIS